MRPVIFVFVVSLLCFPLCPAQVDSRCGPITSWNAVDAELFFENSGIALVNLSNEISESRPFTMLSIIAVSPEYRFSIHSYSSEAESRAKYEWSPCESTLTEYVMVHEDDLCISCRANPYPPDEFDPAETGTSYNFTMRGVYGANHITLSVNFPGAMHPLSSFETFALDVLTKAKSLIDTKCNNPSSVDIWAEPHVSPYPEDVAIIPGDSRFPARYQFTLRDFDGQPYPNQDLTVSIGDANIARLESGEQAGSQVVVKTDAQGRAIVDYVYLGSAAIGPAPFEDTITVRHHALLQDVHVKVAVGLNIEITDVKTPWVDSGGFPKALGMRLQLADGYRPDMDLRSYRDKLQKISGKTVGMKVSTNWLNPPKPGFMDEVRSIFPNLVNTEAPVLYDSGGNIIWNAAHTSVIIEATKGSPYVSIGGNALPAITFSSAGNYWFSVQAHPVILPEGVKSSADYVKGASQLGLGRLFAANALPGKESVFQSVVCSLKPTTKQQFVALTLFVNNPYISLIPVPAAIKMFVKASGIICDFMQGSYATAAANMTSLLSDGLENAYKTGALGNISIDKYLRLGKLVTRNQTYSKLDNLNGAREMFLTKARAATMPFAVKDSSPVSILDAWPADLTLAEYQNIVNQSIAGEIGAHDGLANWQCLGILTDGDVAMSTLPDNAEVFSENGVHVYLCPPGANRLTVQTRGTVDIYRYYRASSNEVYTAGYRIDEIDQPSLLSLALDAVDLQIDEGMDGVVDGFYTPAISVVPTSRATLRVSLNQETYQTGDTFILSVGFENPGDPIVVDAYLLIVDPAGGILSLPDFALGVHPLLINYEVPGHFVLPDTPVLTFSVPAELAGAGQFQAIAAMTLPGTLDIVGGNVSLETFTFP